MERTAATTDYYKTYLFRYLTATDEQRKASKRHWVSCHAQNVASGREDLIVFSAKMLGAIALGDKMTEKSH